MPRLPAFDVSRVDDRQASSCDAVLVEESTESLTSLNRIEAIDGGPRRSVVPSLGWVFVRGNRAGDAIRPVTGTRCTAPLAQNSDEF